MHSRFLYFAGDRLSSAELSAACLDGHLVELGEGYVPADTVETAALRAASLRAILGDTLAATHLSAAWIHGGTCDPPSRHTVQRAVARRLHHVIGRRFTYRDLCIDPADLLVMGGVRVTGPVRTVTDLARVPGDSAHTRALLGMIEQDPALAAAGVAWLQARGRLPFKRPALERLSAWSAMPAQEDVTRYTS